MMTTNDVFSQWLTNLDFEYWSTGQHMVAHSVFLKKWREGQAVLLDVRAPEEHIFLDIPFALKIPLPEIPSRLDDIPRDKMIAVFCSGGVRASVVFAYLHTHGFKDIRILPGGYAHLIPEIMPGKVRNILKNEAS